MSQQPSVGRIVHYHSYGTPGGEFKPEARAAVVTGINDAEEQRVHLAVLNPTGMFFNLDVRFSEVPAPGHWSWPPRV